MSDLSNVKLEVCWVLTAPCDDFVVAENLISYNGEPWTFTVSLLYFRGDQVAHERIYITEGWEAPESRAP